MQVRVEDIEAFLRTAELRSFNRAAGALNITQSALSRRLQKLEGYLGAQLFDRTSRVVNLTVIGAEFVPTAKRMLHEFEHSLTEIRDLIEKRSGSVVIATNMTLASAALPAIIARFNALYPNVNVRTIEDSTPRIAQAVLDGEAEFGLGSFPKNSANLTFEPLIEDPVMVIARADHPLAAEESVRWADLVDYNFIAMRRTSGTYRLLIDVVEQHGLGERCRYQVSHAATLLGLIRAGLGISALPRMSALDQVERDLCMRPISEPRISRTLGLIRREGRSLSPSADALRMIAEDVLQSLTEPEKDIVSLAESGP